jgi:hypothetical protein
MKKERALLRTAAKMRGVWSQNYREVLTNSLPPAPGRSRKRNSSRNQLPKPGAKTPILLICNRPAFCVQVSGICLRFKTGKQIGISSTAASGRIANTV